MILGRFVGVQEKNLDKVYVVVKCSTKEEAIKKANRLFKIKSDNLDCKRVYMADEDGDTFSFSPEPNGISAWAVFRK